MTDPLKCTFEDAEINHLRDALSLTPTARWQWLQQAMEFGASLARSRAKAGLSTFDCRGKLLWSPLHERVWTSDQRPPSAVELDALGR